MIKLRKVLITVKTYPTLSKKYQELVCTAGIRDDGQWVRIYPLPFRKLEYEKKYQKYQWLALPLVKNESDPRPESYKVTDISKIQTIGQPIGTQQAWQERKQIIFEKNIPYTDLSQVIEKANNNTLSLAIFKPTQILDFVIEEAAREWKQEDLDNLTQQASQFYLFQTEEEVKNEFMIVDKLPYKFSYKFKDCAGKESTLMIEDWEIGMLYWNCLKQSQGNEKQAINQVRKKYLEAFSKKDIHLFLGTTRQFHGWAKNPFVIIGVFYPPILNQASLF